MVMVDECINILFVCDIIELIDEVCKVIVLLDILVKQVLIELCMVIVCDNVGEDFGVCWGFFDCQDDNGVLGLFEGVEIIFGGVVLDLGDCLNVNLLVISVVGVIGF